MKLFIGWAGDLSKHVALELRDWLPKVIQRVTPWMSEVDLRAGSRWLPEVNKQLEETSFAIVALTRENAREPWIHFEAGALAKQVEGSGVCPYLIDINEKSEITGPLTQFQIKRADREDTLALMKDINKVQGEDKLSEAVLVETFERWWPDLDKAIKAAPKSAAAPAMRKDRELLEEILERTRSLDRRIADLASPPDAFSSTFLSRASSIGLPTSGLALTTGLTPDAEKLLERLLVVRPESSQVKRTPKIGNASERNEPAEDKGKEQK